MKIEIDVDPKALLEVLHYIEFGAGIMRIPSSKKVAFVETIVDLKNQVKEAMIPKYARQTYAEQYFPNRSQTTSVNVFEESNERNEG
jgi:hypothetical protein